MNASGEITFTIFADVTAQSALRPRLSFEEFGRHLAEPRTFPNKSACPLIKLAKFGDVRTDNNSLRHDQNIIAITGIEADYDGEQMSIQEAQEKLALAGVRAWLYTSPSHTPERPRWRVLAPVSREHAPKERRRFVARLNGALGGVLAPESFRLSQSFYAGRVNGTPYEALSVQGEFIDLLDVLDSIAVDGGPREGASRAQRTQEARDSDPVVARLRARGMILLDRADGGVNIKCPFAGEHTSDGGQGDTTYWPAHTGGFAHGHFKCLHGHCDSRPDAEFLVALGFQAEAVGERQSTDGDDDAPWPKSLAGQAYHGIAGEIVRELGPHTEADPAALLVQVLAVAGAMLDRAPYVPVEGDKHTGNLFVVLVGPTSKARKGTSFGRVRSIFERVTAKRLRVVSGLSSGEGLKFQVRDANGDDPGVPDKRLLVIEPEFAQVLRVAARQGNTLSATVRNAWDTGNLATLTRSDPITATNAHIAIIGHITADELRAELTAMDSANGFANRFLFVCATRSKCLPFGGEALGDKVLSDLAAGLSAAVEHVEQSQVHEVTAAGKPTTSLRVGMTATARTIWENVYPALSEGAPGLFGSVTGRAEAQTLRLALIYALLDSATEIDKPHLLAALAVWQYCADSARHVFGTSLGDPVADEILRALRVAGKGGMTRTEISALFKRNQPAERIGVALKQLTRKRLARCQQCPSVGRPTETWFATYSYEKNEFNEKREGE